MILRGFIRQIRLVPQDGQLEIELDDDLAAILTLANRGPRQASAAGSNITVVAGEGLEPPTRGL